MAMPQGFLVPLHRDGWKFVAVFALVAAGLFFLWQPLGWLGVAATLWCAYFFRDPRRVCPAGANWVLSPADGVVSAIAPAVPPAEIGLGAAPLTRISVFMDVFDVNYLRGENRAGSRTLEPLLDAGIGNRGGQSGVSRSVVRSSSRWAQSRNGVNR